MVRVVKKVFIKKNMTKIFMTKSNLVKKGKILFDKRSVLPILPLMGSREDMEQKVGEEEKYST